MVHVIVVAALLLIHGRCADWRLPNSALTSQYEEQVPERRTVIGAVMSRVSSACATRQVIVNKYGDRNFVDPGQPHPPGAYPAREVLDLSEV